MCCRLGWFIVYKNHVNGDMVKKINTITFVIDTNGLNYGKIGVIILCIGNIG